MVINIDTQEMTIAGYVMKGMVEGYTCINVADEIPTERLNQKPSNSI
jgi:hypothetical protein